MTKYNLIERLKYGFRQTMAASVFVGMLLATCGTLSAQEIKPDTLTVTGKVTDELTGKPLMGVQLWVADKRISAMTDENGAYKINVPTLHEVLLVTLPDYAAREIPLQGRTQIDLNLYPAHFNSGYGDLATLLGTDRKTIATQAANMETDFSRSTAMAVETDIEARMSSDVRAITRSGTPGVGAVMFIRGINSLNANAQPLIIVDDVIWDNQWDNTSVHEGFFSDPLANIDVKDIESITVLKDGNSLYGSKGANGVILIKTTRGKDMTTRIVANIYAGSNLKPRLPKMMNATQYRNYAQEQVVSQWVDYLGYDRSTLETAIPLRYPFMEEDPSKQDYAKYHQDTDWSDYVYQNGFAQSYSLNVNGGDDIALYNFSMGYTSADGVVKNTGMDKITARFNSDIKINDKLKTAVDISLGRVTRTLRDQGVGTVSTPEFIALIKAPILTAYELDASGNPSSTKELADALDPVAYRQVSNPVALIEDAMGTNSRLTFNMRVQPVWQINKHWTVSELFNYGLTTVKESFFIPEIGIAPQQLPNGSTATNEVRDLTQRQMTISTDTRLKWDLPMLPTEHNMSILGGFRYITNDYESDLPKGYNTGNDNIKVLKGKSEENNAFVTGADDQWKSMSWYLNADYNYQKKYFATITAAADASSRFGTETSGVSLMGVDWAIFPSLSGAWLISSEDFMSKATAINLLKLRAGYGLTGNDDISTYAGRAFLTTIKFSGKYNGLQLANIKNKAIQWETTAKANLGLDAHLFNERLTLSFDLFNSQTSNLLTLKRLDAISGLQSYWSNGGSLENYGYEFGFDLKLLNKRDFAWSLSAGIAHYTNKIKSLPDGDFTTDILDGTVLTAVGYPVGVFYGYRTLGVFSTSAEAAQSGLYREDASGKAVYYQAGDVHFADNNFDSKISDDDKQIIGDPNPDFYGSISNRFKYKRITLDVLCNYSVGNDVYNYVRSQLESGSTFYNQTVAVASRWQTEGDKTMVPKAAYGDPNGNNLFSDRWIEDGSYFRLKTITLSYDIPFDSPYLQGITVWASANNLWTWSQYLGSDPEFAMNNKVIYQGIDAGLTPLSKSFYVGLKFNL